MSDALMLCATDAGGARNVAPIAAVAGANAFVLASLATAPLFAEYGIAARVGDASSAAECGTLIDRLRPRAIVCGTTRYPGPERFLTIGARARSVPTIAVLDEWFGYRTRFFADGDGENCLTDIVCCPDESARHEAMAEGLPADRLRVTGSPSLSALADRISEFTCAPPPMPICWAKSRVGERLLFLSENHVLDYGTGPEQPGGLGPWLGYTERDVRTTLARLLADTATRYQVVEKLHPGADHVPAPAAPGWHVVFKEPLWSYLWHADIVIGMRSMALLEAALMGHRPLSFQPNLQSADQCTAARAGLADRARCDEEVRAWLRSPPARGAVQRPAFAASGSAARVLEEASQIAGAGRISRRAGLAGSASS